MFAIKILGLILAFSFLVRAESSLPGSPSPKTKDSMAEFLDQFMGLKKYLVSDEEFQDPKNEEDISSHLKGLAEAIKKTNHDPILHQENFKFSRDVLESHVIETERVFRLGNKSYARWMTNSTLGICMSCHTQMPTLSRQFPVFMRSDFFTSDFDKAEFMFATKNFEGANKIYDEIVGGFPSNGAGIDRLEKSSQREISYLLRVKRDLKAAKSAIDRFRNNKKLPSYLGEKFNLWKSQISQWQKTKLPDASTAKAQEIESFVEKSWLGNAKQNEPADPRFVSSLIVSGLLYEFLQKQPNSPAVPDVLYWLAIIDREMTNSPFYSLADLYLKECMLNFPESRTAMKCYKEYEAEMVLGYTGSAGTNIPKEVHEDLKYLKNFVESKGKAPLKGSAP